MSAGKLKRGYTTGMCAAAAAKGAAIMLFHRNSLEEVEVFTPAGVRLNLKLQDKEIYGNYAQCCVIKDAGDDPDVTNGLAICARVVKIEQGIVLKGGKGVGVVTRPGLSCAPGEPAINPVPREIIKKEVSQVLPDGCGLEVTIFVPEGETVAVKTMNPRLGIVGGISILGTTGIVEPMSEEAFKASLFPQISQAVALGFKDVILTPGRRGEKWATEKYGLPGEAVVQMSNFVGYMLKECVRLGVNRVLLFGHHGKLIKVAAGIFHTHSRVADARLETIITHAALSGVDLNVIKKIWKSATAEEAVYILKENNLLYLMDKIAGVASRRATEYVKGELFIGTAFTSLQGEMLGLDEGAKKIGEAMGWKVLK